MEANFAKALAWVRHSETGHDDSQTNPDHWGNDDDKDDSGGRTSRGITQRECDAYCHMAGLKATDVWKLGNGIVDDIYHRSYWMPYCPIMPPGVDYMLFDDSVLSGPVTAVMTLQRALHVKPDGHIGVVTSAAIVQADKKSLLEDIGMMRRLRYDRIIQAHPKDVKYRGGWNNRVEFVLTNARSLIAA